MESRKIVIVMCRCTESKRGFGIRFERSRANDWGATWAFAIKEAAAQREGYEKTKMEGKFHSQDGFPGCPHCSARGFWLCRCGKLACWNGEDRRVTCPWCQLSGDLGGEVTTLYGGSDR